MFPSESNLFHKADPDSTPYASADVTHDACSGIAAPARKVLLIEPDPAARQALICCLRHHPLELYTAADEAEALAKVKARPEEIGAVLLSRETARKDSMDIASEMQRDTTVSHIPIVLLADAKDPASIHHALRTGIFYYLYKPVDADILASVVASALREGDYRRTLHKSLGRQQAGFRHLVRGNFILHTLEEATELAGLLAQCYDDPERVVGGLAELLINAIEHGNLGIDYEEKTRLLSHGQWYDEVQRRLSMPLYRDRRVTLRFERNDSGVSVDIQDEGDGFDWQPYLTIDPTRLHHTHGRGIAQANLLSFDQLLYMGCGNRVKAINYAWRRPNHD